ncbi:MAG: indole-3-glycerol phosphate synthase TrpC [Chloroherpetonaceae bacterium]|nr:indole-3-glycerol phosphate synthase TrpC [Chloroherpetonaceae bacterium]MCS7211839.1 indole-3-glycerol phosphate synthase TrpC [Chloroherpetonaceae bacterium]MDW8018507.1 indole-3-glycerol phosphate synthase TrpC [Chloroherpetonaceae bacterium]
MAENILHKILEVKRTEVALLKAANIEARYKALSSELPATRRFYAALRRAPASPLRLIAELKKASPSRGVMVENFNPMDLAQTYYALGAKAFSVLTDQQFFQGSIDYLSSVRQAFDRPVLRKDFIIDEAQVYESRLIGADAILLIVAALSRLRLQELMFLAHSLSMETLVEVHTEAELQLALDCGAKIIGINNRNLADFTVDIQTSLRLRPAIPPNVVTVSESGMRTTDDLRRIEEAGFDAVLIGEGLLQKENFNYQWQ